MHLTTPPQKTLHPTPHHTLLRPAPLSLPHRRVRHPRPSRPNPTTPTRSLTQSFCTSQAPTPAVPKGSLSVILLAGGVGSRMGAAIPKQYLPLCGQPIATHSLDTFMGMEEVGQIVIVCDPSWEHIFTDHLKAHPAPGNITIAYAPPGNERYDSVHSGLSAVRESAELVAVHDSARPCVSREEIATCLRDAAAAGAAVLGVPCKGTIKIIQKDDQVKTKSARIPGAKYVARTLDRSVLYEVHTPQIVRVELLKQGFEMLYSKGFEVTDDVSLVEALGGDVVLSNGRYTNIKVTTPEDMEIAEKFLAGGRVAV